MASSPAYHRRSRTTTANRRPSELGATVDARMVTISGSSTLVVLGAGDHDISASLVSALGTDDVFAAVLSALTAAGMRNLPDFVFAVADDHDLRVLRRG